MNNLINKLANILKLKTQPAVEKYPTAKLIQYYESNHPFYKQGCELVDAAHFSKAGFQDGGIQYVDWSVRNNSTHGKCPGNRKSKPYNCVHCQTIEDAIKRWDDCWDW